MNTIELREIYYIYKSEHVDTVALRGVNLTLHPGEITLIMGPSGSGKSTILNLLNCELKPSSGGIKYGDLDLSTLTFSEKQKLRRSEIGYMKQGKNLFDFLSIQENFEFIKKINNETTTSKEIHELLKKFSISDKIDALPINLSQGQQQKMSFLSILLKNPKIILCDEPTGNLDADSRDEFVQLLSQYKSEKINPIMVIVTHDPAFIDIADKIYFLKNGKIDIVRSKEMMAIGDLPSESLNMNSKDPSKFCIELTNEKILEIRNAIQILNNWIENFQGK